MIRNRKMAPGLTLLLVVALVGCRVGSPVGQDRSADDWLTLSLDDSSKWRWVGPAWHEGDGVIRPELPHVEDHLAFYVDRSYTDVEAEFEFKMNDVFGSTGFILRAQDASHYYLVSFPTIGQQARAKHFWACISKADGSGWLQVLRMEMIGGVPSEKGIKHRARVVAKGNEISVWVNGRRGPVVRDDTYTSGRVGLESWATYAYGTLFSNVRVRGRSVDAAPWDEAVQPPQNWFEPYPHGDMGQVTTGLVRAPNGDLVMQLSTVGLVRSIDNGRTWTPLEAKGWSGGFLVGPREGKLLTFVGTKEANYRSESSDNGKTWSKYEPVKQPPLALAETRGMVLQPLHGAMLLRDGSLLSFYPAFNPDWQFGDIHEWGALHNTGWSERSTDGGLTWSAPVPLDGPPGGGLTCDMCEFTSNVQTRAGTVVCFVRSIYSPWMWEARSDNGGETWGPSTRAPFTGYACTSPTQPTASGALLVAGRLPGLAVNISHDDALNWRTYRVGTDTWAMGAMLEVEPDLLLYVYMSTLQGSGQTGKIGYLRAQYLRVTPGGLVPDRSAMPSP